MAQSVKHLTLDFGSGHDLMVPDIESCVRLCADSAESAWDSFSALPLLACKINKNKLKKKNTTYLALWSS